MIVLDTAAWIWLSSDPSQLSSSARTALEDHEMSLVSAISAWEVAMLVAKGRISLDRPVVRWVEDALGIEGVEPAPLDHRIAVLAAQLPGEPPPDPADRMIAATALARGCPLVTPDQRLIDYPFCPTIW